MILENEESPIDFLLKEIDYPLREIKILRDEKHLNENNLIPIYFDL